MCTGKCSSGVEYTQTSHLCSTKQVRGKDNPSVAIIRDYDGKSLSVECELTQDTVKVYVKSS